MVKNAFAYMLFLGVIFPLSAAAQTSLVRFEGGIGSQPLRAGALTNDVLGVNPGGAAVGHLAPQR
jgi:hypothetical protein